MKSSDVRKKYLAYFVKQGHKEIPSASLVPENDPSTLFTSSGMQPLIPYLLGQPHPLGNRLVDSQKSFRSQDIDEVGDNRHTTFFEMLGNWSLGDYFKKEQLPWIWEFITQELGLDPNRLYVSVFEGNESVPRDEESAAIWKNLGVSQDHIYYYDIKKNWWSRSGEPDKMPPGEPGGPDSEVFYDFEKPIHDGCHPNCDCGRFMEIGNSVFMQYQKQKDGSLKELTQKNVDFGGGLERMTAATINNPDIFKTDLFAEIISAIETSLRVTYGYDEQQTRYIRIIADHIKAATFMLNSGVLPSNKQQGYMLRRLLRRAAAKMHQLHAAGSKLETAKRVYKAVGNIYDGIYFEINSSEFLNNEIILGEEIDKFERVLHKGIKLFEQHEKIDGKLAFDLLQSYGFPWELTYEMALERGQEVNKDEFMMEFKKHQELSRSAAKGMFKGGLADKSTETTSLHTAHHLLLAALQKVIDPTIKQRGSNITAERLRMDFNFSRKLTPQEITKVEKLVNQKISEDLPVTCVVMDRAEAEKLGAQMEFGQKYPDRVNVYFVGDQKKYYSAEFCGGPHVTRTGAIGSFKIIKEESSSSGIRRIYATVTK